VQCYTVGFATLKCMLKVPHISTHIYCDCVPCCTLCIYYVAPVNVNVYLYTNEHTHFYENKGQYHVWWVYSHLPETK